MKIRAFQIKNYRSIVNSGFCYLSPDHITSLIGQNESGKTSVLEALKSFYDGTITDDVLRSDLSFPEITCIFTIDHTENLAGLIDLPNIPGELIPFLNAKNEVSITRKWHNANSSTIFIAEEEIINFFKLLELNRISDTNKILSSIEDLSHDAALASKEFKEAENELNLLQKEISRNGAVVENSKRTQSRFKAQNASGDLTRAISELEAMQVKYNELLGFVNNKKDKMQQVVSRLEICRQFENQLSRIKEIKNEIRTLTEQIKEGEVRLKSTKSDREYRNTVKNLDQLKESLSAFTIELRSHEKDAIRRCKISSKILAGLDPIEAERSAIIECDMEDSYPTPEILGNRIWRHIPLFEFFEDFSSLLPNKIDLDDLLNENSQAEGYKAARNFLFIAGLNADFFREENHRILKQKIENLNSEITIDFQDYWRQNLGKNDKITINFELEHYDNSQPDKSGKPYLEFWIKDKQERLYPKQRSRGVRWFLSFYLELKATAKSNTFDRVMLIDEPGLSLHARAQEDVLKVFEDLRQNLQIIYSTHSPNLIDVKKLYRIMAVQRAKESDETSETLILDSRSLNEASPETLSPVYALMGTRLNERQFVFPKNNFIVEDAITFHYLEAMAMLYKFDLPVHFIPASGPGVIPTLVNLLFGWKISFGLVMTDNPECRTVSEQLKNTMIFSNGLAKKLILIEGIKTIEDLFSTIDFKRFILKQRVGITVSNSDYIEMNKLSRMILVSDFHSRLEQDNLQFTDFDEETRQNFTHLFDQINLSIENI